MNNKPHTSLLAMALIVMSAFGGGLMAQEVEPLICSDCQYENDLANRFCLNCGDSMADELTEWETAKQSQVRYKKRFISERVDPPRLFTTPTSKVLGSMDIRLVGGGAFGVATDRSFLGTVAVGLGDIAEVEFSTIGMISNIARGSTVFPTSAFKLLLVPENRWHIPTLAVALRSSANWQDVQSDAHTLRAYGLGENAMSADEQVSNIGYDTRFTTLYGVSTLRVWRLSLHAGISLTDVRMKELMVDYYWGQPSHSAPDEVQKNLIGGFFGFDIESNPQTKLMFEVKTESNYQYNVETAEIDVSEAFVGIGGVRFFFNRWLSTDVGVWYHSSFRGIADMQIKLGLNLFLPGGNIGGKMRSFSKR